MRHLSRPLISMFTLTLAAGLLVAAPVAFAQAPAAAQPAGGIQVGVFDAQAVYNGFPGQQEVQQQAQQLQTEMQTAAQAQDQQRMAQVQQQFQALQQQAMQRFQQALQQVLPRVAETANVVIVVHDLPYAAPGVQRVDLTQQIVEAMRQAAASAPAAQPAAGGDDLPDFLRP